MAIVFWDVDTQVDFIMPDGKLYVTGAEQILPSLEELTECARRTGRLIASVDDHEVDDEELSDTPDFEQTFPPHCIHASEGQKKVPETAALDPLWVSPDLEDVQVLKNRVLGHSGEIIFRKRKFDVFSNPNVEPVLDVVAIDEIFLYGVALDVCNRFAIEGLLSRRVAPISLVRDATQAIVPERGTSLVENWQQQGVSVINTDDVVKRFS